MIYNIDGAKDLLTLMPNTNEDVVKFSSQIKRQLLDGEIGFNSLLYQKAFIEKTLDAIFKDQEVKSFIEDEIDKYGKEGVGYHDAKFDVQSRKTWDYSKSGDSKVDELDVKAKQAINDLKDRQKLLQTIKSEMADTETGEIIYPASFTQTTFIKTTFKK